MSTIVLIAAITIGIMTGLTATEAATETDPHKRRQRWRDVAGLALAGLFVALAPVIPYLIH